MQAAEAGVEANQAYEAVGDVDEAGDLDALVRALQPPNNARRQVRYKDAVGGPSLFEPVKSFGGIGGMGATGPC